MPYAAPLADLPADAREALRHRAAALTALREPTGELAASAGCLWCSQPAAPELHLCPHRHRRLQTH